MTALAILHREAIIDQVAAGTLLQTIADNLGITPPSISRLLASDPEYRQAREIGAELRLHRAYSRVDEIAELGVNSDGEIVGITNEQANLARVRDSGLRAAQWFAEREFPERWGAKANVLNVQVNVSSVDDVLNSSMLTLIEGSK